MTAAAQPATPAAAYGMISIAEAQVERSNNPGPFVKCCLLPLAAHAEDICHSRALCLGFAVRIAEWIRHNELLQVLVLCDVHQH